MRLFRHIVGWSAEEDGVFRAQIALHGTDNWTIIVAQFKDKTTRQCRRRWYHYLNSECKKGGWTREEDMLLCEAQKVLGNKWTEIAKVVSGRRAKDEELYQENGVPCSNTNAKRVLTETGCLTPSGAGSLLHIKQMRSSSSDLKENLVPNMRLFEQEKSTQDARQPLATISLNNQDNVNTVKSQNCVITDIDDLIIDPYESEEGDAEKSGQQYGQIDVHDEQCFGSSQTIMEVISGMAPDEVFWFFTNYHGSYIRHGPCEEHNSICQNVLSGSMEPCPEIPASEKLTELAEDSRLQCMEFESPILTNVESKDSGETPAPQNLNEIAEDSRLRCIEFTSPAHTVLRDKACAENFSSPSFAVVAKDSKPPSSEFTSPAHTVATFQPYADDMPTPKFTASERNFLLSVIELTSPGSRPETSQQPSCKRALLNSL